MGTRSRRTVSRADVLQTGSFVDTYRYQDKFKHIEHTINFICLLVCNVKLKIIQPVHVRTYMQKFVRVCLSTKYSKYKKICERRYYKQTNSL